MRLIAVALQEYLRRDLEAMVADCNVYFAQATDQESSAACSAGLKLAQSATDKSDSFIDFLTHTAWSSLEARLETDENVSVLFFYSSCLAFVTNHTSLGGAPNEALFQWIDDTKALAAFLKAHRKRSIVIEAETVLLQPARFYSLIADKCELEQSAVPDYYYSQKTTPSPLASFLAGAVIAQDDQAIDLQKSVHAAADLAGTIVVESASASVPALIDEYRLLLEESVDAERTKAELAHAKERGEEAETELRNILDIAGRYFIRAIDSEEKTASAEARNAGVLIENKRLKHELKRLKHEIKRAENNSSAIARQLNAVYESFSWRITKPIRAIRRAARRFRPSRSLNKQVELVRASSLFDASWYLEKHPDIQKSKLDPAVHFVRYGGFEGRSPGPDFSTPTYLKKYPDVKKARINPLVHYLQTGKPKGLPLPKPVEKQ